MNWVISNYALTYIVSFKYFSDKEIWSKKAIKCVVKEKSQNHVGNTVISMGQIPTLLTTVAKSTEFNGVEKGMS